MVESNQTNDKLTTEDYNKVPVHYCKNCGSLRILTIPGTNTDYCDECGCTEIGKSSIEAWLELDIRKRKSYNN